MDELERLRADDQAHMDAELAENNDLLAKVNEEVRLACNGTQERKMLCLMHNLRLHDTAS